MKKCFFVFALNFLIVSSGLSQLLLGVKAGYASAGVNTQTDGKKSVNGLMVGGIINYELNDNFSLQLEGLYLKKGGGFGITINKLNYSEYLEMNVLEVPLSLKLTTGASKAKFIANLGPYLGINMNGSFVTEDSSVKTKSKANFDFFDSDGRKYNKFDIGFNLGIGMSIDLPGGKLFFEGRYGIGMKNWYKHESRKLTTAEEIKHRVVSISMGYIHQFTFK